MLAGFLADVFFLDAAHVRFASGFRECEGLGWLWHK